VPNLRDVRFVPRLERSEYLRRTIQSVPGKCGLLVLVAGILSLLGYRWWPPAVVFIALATFAPSFRKWVLLLGSFYWLFRYSIFRPWLKTEVLGKIPSGGVQIDPFWLVYGEVAAVFLTAFGFCWCVRRWRLRRPLTLFLAFFGSLLAIAISAPLPPFAKICLWGFLLILSRYLWYIAYSLHEAGRDDPTPFGIQLGNYFPFWSAGVWRFSSIPIPKGVGYLRKIECRTSDELAVTQLKAAKLLLWVVWLAIARDWIEHAAYGREGRFWFLSPISSVFDLPTREILLRRISSGEPCPALGSWMALLMGHFLFILRLTVDGGVIVSLCRLTGFDALRAVYKPFYSRTFVEYWGRSVFYFKELVADHFFYPTFLRYFKNRPRLRIFAATLAAATLGNYIVHFTTGVENVLRVGLRSDLVHGIPYALYSVFLGLAVAISQLRTKEHQELMRAHWFRREILSRVWVLGFTTLLFGFTEWSLDYPPRVYFRFFLSLFGITV
jgi:hypothetical protein